MKIILLLLFLHTLFYRRTNNLSCGLFGFVGEKAPNFDWIKILGILNQSRGEDSCGILIGDGYVHKELGKFTDFLAGIDIDYEAIKKYEDHTVMGHVRQKSSGVVSLENCHPFEIKKGDKTVFILAHNGTIKWHNELLKKYKVESKGINVDSQAIAHIIAKNPENVSVLGEYKGSGVFTMVNPKKKNTLYVFKGASKEYTHSQIVEERPLFYWTVDGNIYYSSVKAALYALGGNDENVKSFPTNQLLEVKNGEIKVVKEIDRSAVDNVGCYYPWEERPNSKVTKNNYTPANNYPDDDEEVFHQGSSHFTTGFEVINKRNKKRGVKVAGPNRAVQAGSGNFVLAQEPPYFSEKIHGSRVYFWRGQFYRNGHVINKQTPGKETPCQVLTLDNNGFESDSKFVNANRLEDVYFWNGVIIEPHSVPKVNELASKGELFIKDSVNSYIIDTLTLSNLTNCLVCNPAHWFQDAKLNGSFANGEYKARFNCPIVHTFSTGKVIKTDNSKLKEYNDEIIALTTEAPFEVDTVDEPLKEAAILEDGMIPLTEALVKTNKNKEEDYTPDVCRDAFFDAVEDLFSSARELQKFSDDYPEAKIMFIKLISEVKYFDEFIDNMSKGKIGVNEHEYGSAVKYCKTRAVRNVEEIIKT